MATAFQAIDAAQQLEVEFSGGRKAVTAEIWRCQRLEDWALVKVDTGDAPPLKAGDVNKVEVGQRLIAFDTGTGSTLSITGVNINGKQNVPGFGPRIQISAPPSRDAVGGPLLNEFGDVVGIVGGSLSPGVRFNRRDMDLNPLLWSGLPARVSVTPISELPATPPAGATTLKALADDGTLTASIVPMQSLMSGGTTNAISKTSGDMRVNDVTDFSRKDPELYVYTLWLRKDKVSKGMVSAKIYDVHNRLLAQVQPKKTSLPTDVPMRLTMKLTPQTFEPGIYRVDILWDGHAVWRAFFRILE